MNAIEIRRSPAWIILHVNSSLLGWGVLAQQGRGGELQSENHNVAKQQ